MSALTDIYVDNVIGHLPEHSRSDIAAEITATINDMVDDRLGDDEPSAESQTRIEREVLEELGDPALLSREYSNSPQHLIGPKSYPLFIWCMRWVLPLVAIAALVTNAIAYLATTPQVQIGGLIGQLVGNTVVALLVAFAALTILIALGDRGLSGGAADKLSGAQAGPWSVDQLQKSDPKGSQIRAEAILGLVFLVLLAIVPLLPTSLFYVGHLNNGETFINPALGIGWLLGYWAFLALMAVIEVVKLVRSSASRSLLIGGAVVDVAMAIFLTIALLTQQVLHPDLTTTSGAATQQIIAVIAIWFIVVWDQVSTWRTHRAKR